MAANVWGTSWGGTTGSWLASWALEATTPVVVASTAPGPAGKSTRKYKQRRKVLIGDRLYEVDSLSDVELILKRMVRQEAEPVTRAAKARIKVVDRVSARAEKQAPVALPVASEAVDWSALWTQLQEQDAAYANALVRAIARQDEDDIETLLLALH